MINIYEKNPKERKFFNLKKFVWKNRFPLLITLAYFLIFSYIAFFNHNYWSEDDGIYYLQVGEQILEGDGKNVKTVNTSIGGPVVYAWINSFLHEGFVTMKIVALLSGTSIVFVSYFIIKNIFGVKIALVGQLLVAFTPRLELYSIMALNEMLPIALVSISLFFVTKKHLNFRDILVIGVLLGMAFMMRYQSVLVFFGILVFILLRDKKIRTNFIYAIILALVFFAGASPLLAYNIVTHDNILDNSPNWFLYSHLKFQTPELHNTLENAIVSDSKINVIFIDFHLFLKNYFYNLFYHNPNLLFNFDSPEHNLSIIPIIPFIGIIPVFMGFIFYLKPKYHKKNLVVLLGVSITMVLLVVFFDKLNTYFFGIITIPIITLGIIYRKNIEKNFLPLLILPIIFLIVISITPLHIAEHMLMMWIIIPTLSAYFLVEVLPKKIQKIFKRKSNKNNLGSSTKIIIIIILLANVGFSYQLFTFYIYDIDYKGIGDAFGKIFAQEPLEERRTEVIEIAEFLSKQPGIEKKYIMTDQRGYAYYSNSNSIYATFGEGIRGDDLNTYVARENWTPYEIWWSNSNSHPINRHDSSKPIPNYLVYETKKPDVVVPSKRESGQFSDLEILFDSENINIPNNFELIYKSNKTGTVVYKIN